MIFCFLPFTFVFKHSQTHTLRLRHEMPQLFSVQTYRAQIKNGDLRGNWSWSRFVCRESKRKEKVLNSLCICHDVSRSHEEKCGGCCHKGFTQFRLFLCCSSHFHLNDAVKMSLRGKNTVIHASDEQFFRYRQSLNVSSFQLSHKRVTLSVLATSIKISDF